MPCLASKSSLTFMLYSLAQVRHLSLTSLLFKSLISGIAVFGHIDILDGEFDVIVGGPGDLHAVIDVEPLGVVVLLLGVKGDRVHPLPGLVEISKKECFLDGFSAFNHRPTVGQ